MSDPARGSDVRTLMRSGTSIAIAIGVMNLATYGFTIVAARILGPTEYGALAGLMATLMVLAVLQLGLQATAARRISAEPEHVAQIEQSIMRVTYRGALVLGAVLVLAAPLVQRVLRLDSLPAAVLVGVCVVPLSIMGGQAGILQGERRWWPLAAMYVAAGVPRLVLGTAFMLWRPTVTSAMVGVTIAHVRADHPRLDRAARRAAPGHPGAVTTPARSSGSPCTTRRRCWPSSRSPTPTSSSPATCCPTTRPASTRPG